MLLTILRKTNNRLIVDKLTMPTEQEVFPKALRTLIYRLGDILIETGIMDQMYQGQSVTQRDASEQFKYSDYEKKFIEYAMQTDQEEFNDNKGITEDAVEETVRQEVEEAINPPKTKTEGDFKIKNARIKGISDYINTHFRNGLSDKEKENFIKGLVKIYIEDSGTDKLYYSIKQRIAYITAIQYLFTLTDKEFLLDVIEKAGLATPEQIEDLHRPMNSYSQEYLAKITPTSQWQAIVAAQEKGEERE